MKKLTKILLPIAGVVAIAAPVTCMSACSKGISIDTWEQYSKNLCSSEFSIQKNKTYDVSVNLNNYQGEIEEYTGLTLLCLTRENIEPTFATVELYINGANIEIKQNIGTAKVSFNNFTETHTLDDKITFKIVFENDVEKAYLQLALEKEE